MKMTFLILSLALISFNFIQVHGASEVFSQMRGSKDDSQMGYFPSQVLFYKSQFFAVMSIDQLGSVGATPQIRRYLPNNQTAGTLEATLDLPLPCRNSGCTANVLFIGLNQNLLSGFAISGTGSDFSGSLFFSIDLDSFSITAQRSPNAREQDLLGMWGYFPGPNLNCFASFTNSTAGLGANLASLALSTNFTSSPSSKITPFTNILFGAMSMTSGNVLISGDSLIGGAVMMLSSSLKPISAPIHLAGFQLPSNVWPPAAALQNSDLALLSWLDESQTTLSLIPLSAPLQPLSIQKMPFDGLSLVFGDATNIIFVINKKDAGTIELQNYQIISINPTQLDLLGSTYLPQPLLMESVSLSFAQSHSEQYDPRSQQYAIIAGSSLDWTIYIMQLVL